MSIESSLNNQANKQENNETVATPNPEVASVAFESKMPTAEEKEKADKEKNERIAQLQKELVGGVTEALNPRESEVLAVGVKLHQALDEYEKASNPMIARNQADQLLSIYGTKWKKLNEEYNEAMGTLDAQAKDKVNNKLNETLQKMGLAWESPL